MLSQQCNCLAVFFICSTLGCSTGCSSKGRQLLDEVMKRREQIASSVDSPAAGSTEADAGAVRQQDGAAAYMRGSSVEVRREAGAPPLERPAGIVGLSPPSLSSAIPQVPPSSAWGSWGCPEPSETSHQESTIAYCNQTQPPR